jgi:prepilin-type N-terminal cleavage/methylation domain-containing protein
VSRFPASAPPVVASRRRAPVRGFTLIEIMVVMMLVGIMLLWLPARLDGFGNRSKLDSTASTIASVLTAAREMAIIDGHEVRIQVELAPDIKDRLRTGRYRYVVATEKKETPDSLVKPGEQKKARDASEASDEEWMFTSWRPLTEGVLLTGYSQESGVWIKNNAHSEPIEVSFFPDGGVRPPHAWRITCVDLDDSVNRVITIRVNALTSAADIVEGDGPDSELSKRRDPSDFR